MALVRTLVVAGIKRNFGSFLGLFFLMTLTACALGFTVGMYVDLNAREIQALEETGAGDLYAYDVAASLTDDVVKDIESLEEVAEVRVNEALSIPTKFRNEQGEVDKNPTSGNMYGAWGTGLAFNVLNAQGNGFESNPVAPEAGEFYAPISWKVSPGVNIGDTITLQLGDERRTLTLAKFYEDPQMGTPFMEVKRCLVAPSTFTELAAEVDAVSLEAGVPQDLFTPKQDAYRVVEINVDMTDEARAAGMASGDLSRTIAEGTAWGKKTSGMFSAATLMGYAMMVVIIGSAMCAVFALLLFVIALVICTHAVSTSIEEDYADYGTLKALGVGQGVLLRILIVQYAGVSLIGLAFGLAVSTILVPLALPYFSLLTGVLATSSGISPYAVGILAVLVVLVVAVVAFKARKLARISPLAAFRGGSADVSFASRFARTISGKHLNLQLALRAIVSAKRRYVGLLACAFVLSGFIVLVFGIGGTLAKPHAAVDTFSMWMSDVSVRAVSPDVDFDEVERVISEESPIAKSWKEAFSMVNLNGEARSFVGLSDLSLVQTITEGREPRYDNEVIIGPNLARSLGVSVGDEFTIEVNGKKHELLVSGFISGMFNAGWGSLMTYDAFCTLFEMDPDDPSRGWQYTLEDPEAADAVRSALEARFGDEVDARPSGLFSDTGDLFELIQTLFIGMGYTMAGFATVLVFLAVSLIIGRMFTAERHDLGVYRALGFTSRSLRVQFALRFFMVALVGCALGALAAALGGGWLMGQLFGLFGVSQFAIDTNPLMLCSLTLGLALVFLVAAYVSARKVRRVDVRELVVE